MVALTTTIGNIFSKTNMPYIEYMPGRSSGRYLASHPSIYRWYRKWRGFQWDRSYPPENHVIADTEVRSYLKHPLPAALPNSQLAKVRQKNRGIEVIVSKVQFSERSVYNTRIG
jgi:hypothetical protein